MGFLDNVWWPLKQLLRADFKGAKSNADDFLNLLASRGVDATWYPGLRCPCGAQGDGSPAPDCPVCGPGNSSKYPPGWLFPLTQDVKVNVTGLRRDWKTDEAQFISSGEASMTVRAEHCPAYMDRIILDDCRTTKSALLTRKSSGGTGGHVEHLDYPIVSQDYDNSTGGTSYIDVLYLQPVDATTGLPKAALVKGTDYAITAGGDLDFTLGDALGTAPTQNARYTIAYKTRPVYRVVSEPHAMRQTTTAWKHLSAPIPQRLPVSFTARLEWLVEGI